MPEPKSPLVPLAPKDLASEGGPEDVARFKDKATRTGAALNAQPKVRVRLREDRQFMVNGYTFVVKGGEPVEVPEQIADMVEDRFKVGDEL